MAICGALLIIGAVNFEHFAWFAGAAVAVAAILIPSVYLMILEDDFAPNWIIITIHSVLFAGAVIFLFVNPAVSFCLGIALALSYPIERMLEYITMSYVLNIYWSNTDEKLLWHYMTKTIAAPVGSSIVAISAAFIFFPENIMEAIVIGLSVGLLYGGLVLTIDDTGYSRFDRIRFAGILSLVIAAAGIVFLFINAFLSLCLAVPTIAMGIAMIAVKDGYDPEWLGTRKNGIVSLIAGLALLLVSIALIIVPMLLSGQIDNFFSEFSKNFL